MEFEGDASFDSGSDRAKNRVTAVGFKDRTFVARGSKIGVFRHDSGGSLQYQTTQQVRLGDGAAFEPEKV